MTGVNGSSLRLHSSAAAPLLLLPLPPPPLLMLPLLLCFGCFCCLWCCCCCYCRCRCSCRAFARQVPSSVAEFDVFAEGGADALSSSLSSSPSAAKAAVAAAAEAPPPPAPSPLPSHVRVHAVPSNAFLPLLGRAHGVVSTAGHTLLSECMFLGTPVLAVPLGL